MTPTLPVLLEWCGAGKGREPNLAQWQAGLFRVVIRCHQQICRALEFVVVPPQLLELLCVVKALVLELLEQVLVCARKRPVALLQHGGLKRAGHERQWRLAGPFCAVALRGRVQVQPRAVHRDKRPSTFLGREKTAKRMRG